MKFKIIAIILILFSLISCHKKIEPVVYNTGAVIHELSVLSFNIQIFGKTKSSKQNVMKVIVDILDDYDLIAIQEIRDASNITLTKLMKQMPQNYKITASDRDGRTSSKEQTVILYNDNKLDLIWDKNYDDINDKFERSPYFVYFISDDKLLHFIVTSVHISPQDVNNEIQSLATICTQIHNTYKQPLLIMGDFNSDGKYFNENKLSLYFKDNLYDIVITNDFDTTVAPSDNTYDRIIVTDDFDPIKSYGVVNIDKYLIDNVTLKEISDHYPVYMIINY